MPLSPLLGRYTGVVLDLDGCVWVGDRPTPGAGEAVAELRAAGKSVVFLTNDSRRSPEEYVRKLWSLGLQASPDEVVTAGAALQYLLADGRPGMNAYVIGSPAVFRHVADAGVRISNRTPDPTQVELVIVAGHDGLDFAQLRDAVRAIAGGAQMIAANRDATVPTEGGLAPGTGAFVAALEYATGQKAEVAGKPQPGAFRTALDRLPPGRVLVVGDRLDADLGGAAAAGLDAAIVLTGVTSREQAVSATDPAPVAIAENLHALVTAP